MKNELIFATNNANKVAEIKNILGSSFRVISLKDAGIEKEIPEPFDTLEENAQIKSSTIYQLTGKDCFSEDTGLFTDALNGAPGVKSARYAGEQAGNKDNIQKLLKELDGKTTRKARFRTVVSLILNGNEHQFEGVCEGSIIEAPRGDKGFGYDSVFIPDGSDNTFAEMEMAEKNKFSHRKKAIAKLTAFLSRKSQSNG